MDMPSKKEKGTNKIGAKEKQTRKPTLAGVLLLIVFLILGVEGAISFIMIPELIEKPLVLPFAIVHKGMIIGRVIDDETSEGLEGVRVAIDKYSTQTDAEGNFVLKNIPIGLTVVGAKEMTVSKDSYIITRVRVGILPETYAQDPQFQANETIRLARGKGITPLIEGKSMRAVKAFLEVYKFFGGFSIVGAIFAFAAAIGAIERKFYTLIIVSSLLGLLALILGGMSISLSFCPVLIFFSLILILLSKDEFFQV
jgi:hypothetical protein